MSNELLVTIVRLGYLALLWLMVLACLSVLRRDIFGTVVTPRGRGRNQAKLSRREQKAAAKAQAAEANTEKPKRSTTLPGMPGTFPTPDTEGPLRLIVTGGPLAGTSLPLGSAPLVIGRAPDCTLVLDDSYASSHHARLYPTAECWMLEDLSSTNGTYIDDERVVEARRLCPGIRFRVGQTTMEIGR
ncbi:hypothetical protein BK816_00115 [Boudabousia tangfeifanii]|uniref:FHA domain-containing protein n=1 Tax=Boudabousia tangfeifanii TaxID=1912795 RepID=A0A1D9MHW6_9ACTO|nr:FHA domain-containing protein [Boudabousia tangfeifanii]AOZ71887.1 hypothetical protein BK816_00115 [Boudabousia tangfeifanii]